MPIGVALVAALGIGGGLDLVHAYQRSDDDKKPAAAKAAVKKNRAEPRYVVGVRLNGTALVVRDVRTGRDVGLPVAAPAGRRFQQVAASGGTYVVASSDTRQVTFQRLRLDKNGQPKDLTPIPNVTVPGTSTAWSDLAVGPKGDRIAYVTYRGKGSRVDVISSSTSERKVWTARMPARISGLSWAGDSLAFVWSPLRTKSRQIRVLDTRASSGDLKISRPVFKLPPGTGPAVMSRDGRTIVAGVARGSQISLQAYSLDTGRPTRVLWAKRAGGALARLDHDTTGGHLLASASDGNLYAAGVQPVPAEDLRDVTW
ncbi:hypothetical protein [Spirillospora sp. CA-294931]|uniref:hypothetical protein n=1 Tax=Spirillospora sp. CA-294931 TaxID=3240042 RepID=UPI003D8F23CB